MIKRFTFVWIVYWLIYLLQPVSIIYPNVFDAFVLQISFVILLVMGYLVAQVILQPIMVSRQSYIQIGENKRTAKIINYGLIISFFGLVLLLYDKVFIQGIDFRDGFAAAREQWRRLGEDRGSAASSIYSSVGYLIGSSYFISSVYVFSKKYQMSDRKRMLRMLLCISLLLANSLITGGRSSILLLFSFILYSYSEGRKFGRLFDKKIYGHLLNLALVGICLYIIYIFSLRAAAGDKSNIDYSLDFLPFLGFEPKQWFSDYVAESAFGDFLVLVNLSLSYLTHSIATTTAIIAQQSDDTTLMFIHLYRLLAKLGFSVNLNTDWFLSGRFPSLPGELYFQYRIYLFTLISIVIGFLASTINVMHKRYQRSDIAFLLCCSLESILILSPFLFAGDFISFPFALTGGAITILLSKVVSKKDAA